jgi:uncharacterized protein YodC (DUF2158 family)
MESRMSNFNPGDQVILKSGGPVMTVETVDGGIVTCIWFDGKSPSQRVVSHKFPNVVLEEYNPGGSIYIG